MKLLLFSLTVLSAFANGYNILILMPYPGRSHLNAFLQFFNTLANRGHNLTLLSYFQFEHESIQSFQFGKDVLVHTESLETHGNTESFSRSVEMFTKLQNQFCEYGLKSEVFQEFLKNHAKTKFDLILAENFCTDCFLGLINIYKAPLIGLSSCAPMPWQGKWLGATPNPAYVQNVFGGFSSPMSFWNRVENTLLYVYTNLWYDYVMAKFGNQYSKKYIGYEAADPHNTSLMLINSHYTLTGVQPLTPNMIEVGGIHISRKPQKLKKDLDDWINNADAGVIYFNLGSMIKSDTFPEEQRRTFLKAFAKFPQRVLWKWENNTMPDKPDNVMINKWMPQYDILCHPNVKLFLSHGGLLGTIEAVHCGKPLVIMPQFGDQRHNAYAMENNGVAVILHLQTATEEQIVDAIKKALKPETIQNAKSLSEKFRDRPLSPMDSAVYWVEHIARHKGGQHMRSKAIDMPFYQVYLLDVIGFLVIILFFLVLIIYKIIRLILSLGSKVTKATKQKTL